MIFAHLRTRRRLPLSAAGALRADERAQVARHIEACPACRREHQALRAFLERLDEDPHRARVRDAALPVSLPVLVSRVERRIDETLRARPARPGRARFLLPLAAALALALGLPFLARQGPPRSEAPAAAPAVSAEALARLERTVAREQAARYLGEAQDVLATVAASPRDCDRAERRVDVEAERRRSRELLARRALLLDVGDGSAVRSARPVLDDVEEMLREVASLEDCARFPDLERLQGEIERRQLLMKVRLMQRELLG